MKKYFAIFLLGVAAHAADAPVRTLVDHYNYDGELGRKSGTNRRTNEDRGYLVSIEAAALFTKSDSLYVYTSTLGVAGEGLVPVGLKRTPEFSLEFDSAAAKESELQRYNQRLAQEGGGDPGYFKQKQKVRMWVLGKPAGFMKYPHPTGQIDQALAFEVVKVCKKSFRECRVISTGEEKKGFFDSFFGGK